jgi:hypothetical protein
MQAIDISQNNKFLLHIKFVIPLMHHFQKMLLDDLLLSKGQILFFLVAMAAFAFLMIFLYTKDKKRDASYFKGTWKIFAVLIIIVTILFLFVMSQK